MIKKKITCYIITYVQQGNGFSLSLIYCNYTLISIIFAQHDNPDGAQDNPQVEPNGPIFEVIQIVFDACFHFFQHFGFTAPSIDLSPTGNSWFSFMAQMLCKPKKMTSA